MDSEQWGYNSGTVRQSYVAVALALTPFVPRAPIRRVLVISPPPVNAVNLFWDNSPPGTAGIRLVAGGQPLVFSKALHGAMVTEQLNAMMEVAPGTVVFAEEGWK